MNTEIVLAGAVRTPIGKFGGSLANIPAPELCAIAIREALARTNLPPSQIDEAYLGCILQAAQGMNVARQATINAGLPSSVPALTLNNLCGSGLKAVNMAAAAIRAGDADIILAGGMENMSAAAYALPKARFGYRMNNGALIDTMISDALWCPFNDYHMGVTAENVAEQHGITRNMQDEFAAESQQKAEAAQKAGKFQDEIVPVPVTIKRETSLLKQDEYPRSGVTAESLSTLKPAFKELGSVTPGNSSGINDGAAVLLVMSGDKARQLGITPLAKFVCGASAGVNPEIMGIGPAYSTEKALRKAGLKIDDIDLIEANEAFAAQAVAVGKMLGWDAARVNVNGGAIALGHPVGASGARILVTLLHEMKRRRAKRGLATLCVGGGMGVTTIVEACA